jgi:hypothetical protein
MSGANSCKPAENTAVNESTSTSDPADAGTETTGGAVYRFIVSMYSIGEGTDLEAANAMQAYLTEYRARTGLKLPVFAVPWGREGEVDFCFTLDELNPSAQKEFIAGLKQKLEFSNLVQYAENERCSHLRD